MLAVFALTVYGKNVFSKESEWLRTVNVFVFVPRSAEFKQLCSVQGSSPWWPSRELYVLWPCDLRYLCHCSIQCLYALWVTNSPAEMCFSVATLLLAATESEVFWNWR